MPLLVLRTRHSLGRDSGRAGERELEVQRAIARVLKDLPTGRESTHDPSLKRRSVEVARREADGLLVKGGIDERRARRVWTTGPEAGHHTENRSPGNAIV